MEQQQGADVFFLLMGAILVLAMHAGFAFLEVGTVRHKNQVNALVKILVDFAISTTVYFAIGYSLSYGVVVSRERRDDQRRPGLSPSQIFLPRHVRGRRTRRSFQAASLSALNSRRSVRRRR